MLFGPTLPRALGPESVVLIDDGGHKIVGLLQSLGWESFGVHVLLAQVAVVA